MTESGRPRGDESFASVAEHAPAMLWRGDAAGKCVYLNRAQRQFWGVPEDGIDSFTWSSTLLAEDQEKVFGPFSEGMAKQQSFTCEARYRRADGEIRILRTHAEPYFDADGAFIGMVGVNTDITEERRAQTEMEESEARLRALADNLPYGMVYQLVHAADGSRRFTFLSGRCKTLNGIEAEHALADPALLYELILPEHREAFARAEAAAMAAMSPFEADVQMRHVDGAVRWFRMSSAPRPLPNGDVIWDGVQVDVDALKAADERRRLLMKEMSHRIKNNLSTVLSISAQTGRSASTYKDFHSIFHARLTALAKSHDLLLRDSTDSAELKEILEHELGPYTGGGSGHALTLAGPSVRLEGHSAIGLALVVHELATNAAKYGAYSAPHGAINVAWAIKPDGAVEVHWRERGGPPATAPSKLGFGSRLIESVLRSELSGAIVSRFTDEGFEAEIVLRPPAAR